MFKSRNKGGLRAAFILFNGPGGVDLGVGVENGFKHLSTTVSSENFNSFHPSIFLFESIISPYFNSTYTDFCTKNPVINRPVIIPYYFSIKDY